MPAATKGKGKDTGGAGGGAQTSVGAKAKPDAKTGPKRTASRSDHGDDDEATDDDQYQEQAQPKKPTDENAGKKKKFDAVAGNARVRRSMTSKINTVKASLEKINKAFDTTVEKEQVDFKKKFEVECHYAVALHRLVGAFTWSPTDDDWQNVELIRDKTTCHILATASDHQRVAWKLFKDVETHILRAVDGKVGQEALDALEDAVDLDNEEYNQARWGSHALPVSDC